MERIRLGDTVQVMRGKEAGNRAKVTKILRKQGKVVLEGLNKVTRHKKATQAGQKGQIVEQESPIQLSNVMPIDPSTDKPTRVRYQKEQSGKIRAGKSGTALDVAK